MVLSASGWYREHLYYVLPVELFDISAVLGGMVSDLFDISVREPDALLGIPQKKTRNSNAAGAGRHFCA